MAPKKKAVNKKSPALRKSPQKKKTRSRSPEPPPQLDPVDDVEGTERDRDSSISKSDASDDGAATATATTTAANHKTRKPKTKMARSLTKEEEDEVIEWLQSNRFLYDKSSFEFKNRQKKERAWLEMDQKMRMNPGDLYRWYTSLRTQYVKEVKKKETKTRSGAGAVDDIMTPRITWLLEKFEFVKQYVCQARATRGSKIHRPDQHSDCSESSVTPQTTLEGTSQSATTSTTTASISDCLDKVSQQLAEPKNDIEKTCDFLGMLMARMTPSCLEDFTHEATCKAMEYVKQSNLERRQAQQPPQVTFLQPPQPPQLQQASQPLAPQYALAVRNLAASNPPANVLQYPWTECQPANLQPVLSDQLQPTAYSTPVHSGTQARTTTTTTSTDTAAALTGAFQTLNPNTSFNSSFNLSDYIPATPKTPTTDAQ
uniref:uncharacterized protein n=1 Tax=Myxine glutinosa TaxID=7769 RepID=UPI00358E8264